MLTINEYPAHAQTHNKGNSYWVNDARGIPLRRACEKCEHLLAQQYRPEVLGTSGRYEDVVEEAIEPDDAFDPFDVACEGESLDSADHEFDRGTREMFGP